MSLIVKKFGGSSVANAERVFNVAKIIIEDYKKGNDVVVVVSAQGDTTDDLIDKANEINPDGGSKRELDMLLSAGEQISIALLAMAIEKLGFPVISLTSFPPPAKRPGDGVPAPHSPAERRTAEIPPSTRPPYGPDPSCPVRKQPHPHRQPPRRSAHSSRQTP